MQNGFTTGLLSVHLCLYTTNLALVHLNPVKNHGTPLPCLFKLDFSIFDDLKTEGEMFFYFLATHTPLHTSRSNASAARWLRFIAQSDWTKTLILSENHLHRFLTEYGEYYNNACPHHVIVQRFIISIPRQEQRT